ncbi:MAG: type II secretion system protein [Planctomycetes bacterium]|nr:type II secretion system protein [Planctomycetota bacterium]
MHGFTLIEILAVVVIMSLLFAVTANGLRANHTQNQDLRSVLKFDQDMRQAARLHGSLTVDIHGMRIEVRSSHKDHAFHREMKLPIAIRFRTSTGTSPQRWAYDARGRSIDLQIHSPKSIASIAGLTGAYELRGKHTAVDGNRTVE